MVALAVFFAQVLPAIGRSKTLLKPVTMSLFGMLNWHYMWFRDGGTMSDRLSKMVFDRQQPQLVWRQPMWETWKTEDAVQSVLQRSLEADPARRLAKREIRSASGRSAYLFNQSCSSSKPAL